jgi:hypothetical protein
VALSAQNVSVSGFAVTAGSPATLTFKVEWTPTGKDSVWVFADYNTAGTMKRLPLTAATASAGTVYRPGNSDQGAWVVAPGGGGAFNATVTLFSNTPTGNAGMCAYAINHPPVGQFKAFDTISFTGTPPFEVTFADGGGTASVPTEAAKSYPFTGKTIAAFTDATQAPGVTRCKTPNTYTLTASAASYCQGAGVTFALSGTERGAVYLLYKGMEPAATLTGAGSAASFTGLIGKGTGVYSAQVAASQAFCAAEMTGTLAVAERPLPTELSLTVSPGTICQTRSTTLTASAVDSTSTLAYSINGGASWTPAADNAYFVGGEQWQTSATFSVTPTTTQSYPLYVMTAEGCSATLESPATVTVTAMPAIVKPPANVIICENTTARLDVLTEPAATHRWYEGNTFKLENNGTMATYTTAPLNATTTYTVIASIGACSVSGTAVVSMSTVTECCGGAFTKPDATVNFTAFAPCTDAAVGTTWYLTDTREADNVQTYKVRKMPDGKIWMVQDIKFGNRCDDAFAVTLYTEQTGKVTSIATHYGDCYISPYLGAGYQYDINAAVNESGWFIGLTAAPQCVNDPTCRGVCPVGWRVPPFSTLTTLVESLKTLMSTDLYGAFFNNPWFERPEIADESLFRQPLYHTSTTFWDSVGSYWYLISYGYQDHQLRAGSWYGNNSKVGAFVRCVKI